MTVAERGRTDFRRGLSWGLLLGLILGIPAGVALKAAGYPSDELYLWLVVLGVAYLVTVIAASLTAVRHVALAGGLALGATLAMALAPLLVVIDIVTHSE